MSAAIHICALFLAIVNIISAVDYAKVPDATRDPNTKLILWGARSANANPRKFFEKKDTRKWGKEEEGELNKFGKEQSYFLGQALRKFVGNDADQSKNFLNLNFLPSESAFYTSNPGKCQETLQVALASLYLRVDPPDNWIQKEFSLCNWNPVQYSINQTLLKIHDVGCPKSDEAWDVLLKKGTPESEKLYTKHRDLLDYMDKKTGWNSSLESASEFAENLIQMQDYYKIAEGDWPDWLTKNLPSGYNDRETLVNGYAIFSEVTQRACAKDKACQRIMSGYWLNHILETIGNVKNGKDTRKLLGYVSTTEETLSLMKAMFVKGDFLTKAGGFLVEVRDSPEWAVRVLKHHPIKFSSGKKAHKIYKEDYTDEMAKVADKNGWVKLDDFNRLVKPNAFNDWRSECGLSSGSECEDESTAVTGASVVATLPPATCSMFCPRPPKKDSKPDLSDIIKDLLTEKINTIKKLLNSLLPLFKSSDKKNPGLLEGLLGGLGKLLDDLLSGLLSGLKGDLDPLKKLSAALDKLLADLPKVETPTIPDDDARAPRALLEPTRRRRQAIQLLGLEGLIANVLKLVKQLVNDLLPALQKLLKDIGPDLLQLLDKLLGSLRELLDKVLTGLILALDGNSSFLSALSGGLKLLGALG